MQSVVPTRGGDMSPPYKGFHGNDTVRLSFLSLRSRCAHRLWQSLADFLYAFGSSCTGASRMPRAATVDRSPS